MISAWMSIVSAEEVIFVSMVVYKNDSVSNVLIMNSKGRVMNYQEDAGEYYLKALDSKNKDVWNRSMNIFVGDIINANQNESTIAVSIPYSGIMRKIVLLHQDKLIFSHDLSALEANESTEMQGREAGNGIGEAPDLSENKIPADTRNSIENYIYPALFILSLAIVGFLAYRRLRR